MNAVKDLVLSVPEDLSLVVICGVLSMMLKATPSLTGMDLQPSELGVHSVRLLMHKLGNIDGEYPENMIVSSKIIEGDSCSSI
jgi:DNA-binding LacI/PurR family transcriptional regulator